MVPRRLSCLISANQREAETSENANKHLKHVKACPKGNDVITNVISANQHFASIFSMQIFKFQRRSCKLPFLSPSRRQKAPESLLAGYHILVYSQYSEWGATATENGKSKKKVSHKSKARDYGVLDPTTRLQRERLKIGLISKTTTLHVHHNFLHISLPFLHG